ncbi:hypothetical protein TREMEDRAFT_36687 [Tremella mesenterica DSM 1558]|uniref:uncharacterized protein n=1 Tax=Tremella mesenterica (strain ATCC 24925 / CBS 8224 / DSM 1558 / NBRC 9311 / NRRL Y-6157 / RJB 2259-6 / UBC 559-6) TaxID=578456 RepID=UPI0003F4966C|nr:uncharacterized protein TREMEDRAFT_36687 [Tremella mesenterica DSM 1558]EIW72414.1 hypothetical protein TREMEDRAFT_36687 [Tremella mesenterica DSM 1558]
MVALDINDTSKALAVSGGYVAVVGLVSYFLKEKLFMSEALLATVAGIIFGPRVLNWFNPQEWIGGSDVDLNHLTFQITRIVIGIQVLFTGIALPKAYLKKEWLSLTTLLGPIMLAAWFVTSLLIWGLIPGLTFLECLVIAACVTPTDPVLANSICKGRFAEKHVPAHVRNIIVAESGANDGLGFPFLYIGLYLMLIKTPDHPMHSVGGAIAEWIYNVILYQILLSVVIGAIIGFVARKILKFAEARSLIDHESFLSFGVALTFFTLGVVGILGSDDILCCFIVGNSFTWDDWFRVQTESHAFQDVIDQLLSSAIFLYIGAIMPWSSFGNFHDITVWRLVCLGLLVMLLRRLPWVIGLASFKMIPTLPTWRESAFAGFFGPIGVGAVFYNSIALEVIPVEGRENLRAVVTPVVYFLVLTSVVIHGITIPVGKGFQRARTSTLSRSQTTTAGIVSRLPPPVPLERENARFDEEARTRTPRTLSRSTSMGIESGTNVHFSPLDGGKQLSGSPLYQSHQSSTTGTSLQNQSRENLPRSSTVGSQGITETAWNEGNQVVIESEGGENVRVLNRRSHDAHGAE